MSNDVTLPPNVLFALSTRDERRVVRLAENAGGLARHFATPSSTATIASKLHARQRCGVAAPPSIVVRRR